MATWRLALAKLAKFSKAKQSKATQRIAGDGDSEVLGDLAATEQGADRQADLVGTSLEAVMKLLI